MTRWALRSCTAAELWFLNRTREFVERTAAKSRDRGQNSIEYLGLAVVIAVIIGVLATTNIGNHIRNAINAAIDRVAGGKG